MYTQTIKAVPFTVKTFDEFQSKIAPKGMTAAMHLVTAFAAANVELFSFNENIMSELIGYMGISEFLPKPEQVHENQNTRDPDALIEAYLALNKVDMPIHLRNQLFATIKKTCRDQGFEHRGPPSAYRLNLTFKREQRKVFIRRHDSLINRFCVAFDVNRSQLIKE